MFRIHTTKARKDYQCVACEAILRIGSFQYVTDDFAFTLEEKQTLEQAMANGFKIKKGEIYTKWIYKDGDVYTCRAIPAISAICSKYSFWEEF